MQVERLESLRSTFSSVRAHNEVGVQQGAFLPSLALGFPLQVALCCCCYPTLCVQCYLLLSGVSCVGLHLPWLLCFGCDFLFPFLKVNLTGESLTLGVSTALASLLGSAKIGNSLATLATVHSLSEYFAVCSTALSTLCCTCQQDVVGNNFTVLAAQQLCQEIINHRKSNADEQSLSCPGSAPKKQIFSFLKPRAHLTVKN